MNAKHLLACTFALAARDTDVRSHCKCGLVFTSLLMCFLETVSCFGTARKNLTMRVFKHFLISARPRAAGAFKPRSEQSRNVMGNLLGGLMKARESHEN